MDIVSSNKTTVEVQSGLFESFINLLLIKPIFLLGVILISILLVIIFKKYNNTPRFKTSFFSFVLYYYLCILFTNVVGIPTFREYIRLSGFGESFFNPNINLIPFSDGFTLSFILNIFLFIPLGFLCPVLSRTFERARNTFFIGLGLTVLIEISQLFTIVRATDIDDLLTNVTGAMIGYLCFKVAAKLRLVTLHSSQQTKEKDYLKYWPVTIIIVTFVLGFFS